MDTKETEKVSHRKGEAGQAEDFTPLTTIHISYTTDAVYMKFTFIYYILYT